jgi:hypothetical protein
MTPLEYTVDTRKPFAEAAKALGEKTVAKKFDQLHA